MKNNKKDKNLFAIHALIILIAIYALMEKIIVLSDLSKAEKPSKLLDHLYT